MLEAPSVLWCCTFSSWLGHAVVASSPRGLSALLLGNDPDALLQDLCRRFPNRKILTGPSPLAAQLPAIQAGLDPLAPPQAITLDLHGTPFQQKVWQVLQTLPAGATTTYGQLAMRCGRPGAARAVAAACAANPVAVLVPCHRVLRGDGGLAGYRWGLERKRALLQREAQGQHA